MTALTSVGRREGVNPVLPSSDTAVDLTRFLAQRGLAVLDVLPGAAKNGRRLLLGAPGSSTATHVVAMSLPTPGASTAEDPVDVEHRVLGRAAEILAPELQSSLPRALHPVAVQGLTHAVAMTAVPYLGVAHRPSPSSTRDLAEAMPDWLSAVWADSADGTAPSSLGADAMAVVPAANGAASGTSDRPLGVLRRARDRVAEFEVPRTLTHGCLCARHVIVSGGHVIGVDDWGRGETTGDPLRDLGRFAAGLAGDRLPEVLAGRTSFAATVRQLMGEAMALTPVPARLWREVLVLSQLEMAVEARLHGDPHVMVRLGHAVRVLQAPDRTRRGS